MEKRYKVVTQHEIELDREWDKAFSNVDEALFEEDKRASHPGNEDNYYVMETTHVIIPTRLVQPTETQEIK